MKTITTTIIAIVLIFLSPCLSMADGRKNESGKGFPGQPGYQHDDPNYRLDTRDRGPQRFEDRRDDRNRGKEPKRKPDRYRAHRDYHDYRGYRERPYDRGRHYGHYKHKGNRFEYYGHWRSWDEWDRYARRHPEIYKHGQYYRDNAHLMFRFCEPVGGACFFFSIGR
ncbi:hypothetical protein [Desulfosarcina ovata]|uniref:hypothetical protein n=1 Tax=Desulfosarcina ovata TaxID=83564 RepID=UPI0012D33C64|nr:hypothetical protein [Desulfosarcina ovata]